MEPEIQRPSSGLRSENAEPQAVLLSTGEASLQSEGDTAQEADGRNARHAHAVAEAAEGQANVGCSTDINAEARHVTPTRTRGSPPRPGALESPFRRPAALQGPFMSGLQSPEVRDTHCAPTPLSLVI